MLPQFQRILSLTTTHSYFADKTCRVIHFKPTTATQKLMQQLGLLFKTDASGFSVFLASAEEFSRGKTAPENSKEEIFLQFDIICSDPNFFLYTDLKGTQTGCLNYSSNADLNKENNGITELEPLANAKNYSLHIALVGLLDGTAKKNEGKFEISFTAKATQWRYILINKSNSEINDLRIHSKETNFTNPVEVTLKDGEKALLFSSGNTLMPLSESANFHFSLTSAQSTIINNLPTPNLPTDSFVTNDHNLNQLTSDVLIFI